jgi:catechol 2,3-dioxygenase-like lactoylglutathione lyase family enzyme
MKPFNSTITFLHTADLEETTQFYESVMKFTLVVDQGDCRIFQALNGSFLGFCSHDFLVKEESPICLTFVCNSKEEVDDWYTYLQKKEVSVKEPPKENKKFKIYNFFAKDPNGYTIEIQYFLHPFP